MEAPGRFSEGRDTFSAFLVHFEPLGGGRPSARGPCRRHPEQTCRLYHAISPKRKISSARPPRACPILTPRRSIDAGKGNGSRYAPYAAHRDGTVSGAFLRLIRFLAPSGPPEASGLGRFVALRRQHGRRSAGGRPQEPLIPGTFSVRRCSPGGNDGTATETRVHHPAPRQAQGEYLPRLISHRPGRGEPRALKRRRHRYPPMQRPREPLRAELRKT